MAVVLLHSIRLFHTLCFRDTITVLQIRLEAVIIEPITEAELAKELRQRYIQNPPEGMTSDEVRHMSDDDLLDMDYFLYEFDDCEDDDFGEEGFYIF